MLIISHLMSGCGFKFFSHTKLERVVAAFLASFLKVFVCRLYRVLKVRSVRPIYSALLEPFWTVAL